MSGQTVPSQTYSNGDRPSTAFVSPSVPAAFTLREPDDPFGPVIGSEESELATDKTEGTVGHSAPDRLVKSMLGVIVGTAENVVSVRLKEADLVVDFPRVLFPDSRHVHYAQPVAYEVRERANGYRYQTFVAVKDEDVNPYLSEVQTILGNVKLR